MSKLKFKYGYPSPEKIQKFVEYLLSFYGADPKHDACYPEIGMTEEDAKKVTETYLNGDYEWHIDKGFHMWLDGDSTDREFCGRVLFQKRDERIIGNPDFVEKGEEL